MILIMNNQDILDTLYSKASSMKLKPKPMQDKPEIKKTNRAEVIANAKNSVITVEDNQLIQTLVIKEKSTVKFMTQSQEEAIIIVIDYINKKYDLHYPSLEAGTYEELDLHNISHNIKPLIRLMVKAVEYANEELNINE
jgi:hypothetical protein